MTFIPSVFILLLVLDSQTAVSQSSDPLEPMCYDWGGSSVVHVLVEQSGFLSCPLFSHPAVYNYSSTQSTGHNLFWYRVLEGQDLEQPITKSARLSKDRDRLWLQPANANDTGQYICMIRNKTSCSKIAMRLTVLRPEDVTHGNSCAPAVAVPVTHEVIPFQKGKILDCPDAQEATKMADSLPTVTWVHLTKNKKCDQFPIRSPERQVKGLSLQVHIMTEFFQGLYFCTVQYQRRGRALTFTRVINVSAINDIGNLTILQPTKDYVFNVKQDEEARLVCTALFPYLNTPWEMWWTIDGKTVEQFNDPRFSKTARRLKEDYGDRTEQSVLIIQDFQRDDLNREFNCSVKNGWGNMTLRANLKLEVSLPSLELGCGLGVTLFLMLLLFIIYHVFWLELLLLYRSWFGTDERHTDDKEFDVYISYARNTEEEQFVLSTLRSVLENDLGYSVCIFDRDSLPGGTITDETLSFVARSRRLLVVISPGYVLRGSQALLELKAGIDGMALGGHLRVILVQYRPVKRQMWVRELRRARVALVLVRWQGDESKQLTSRFWKRLRVELPLQRKAEETEGGGKDVALMRMSSQNSQSSQTGLISQTTKSPQTVYNYAA
ncbi:interleukin-1 receptor accessory protein-like isoform X2 [Periophthalmus magnuspinnatus]|uniref:interleukin-1 receptor accessory protein-like isoform X2 n=1 Tax=Periophthalmus magnuspinnatus TaxID=409849 RepID=UPI0024369380|nr:interleukin-1 receptor accessory protein-like isoform X2 [Periophthalmus magnuspinnatus]